MDVIVLPVKFDKMCADSATTIVEACLESVDVVSIENVSTPLCTKNKMNVKSKNAIPVRVKKQKKSSPVVRTLKVRVKDSSVKWLREQAREVNQVWNYSNSLSKTHFDRKRKFISAFEIQKYLAGFGEAGGKLGSTTVQQIPVEFCTRRKQFKKIKLKWRKSSGSKRSLGWVPFKKGAALWKGTHLKFNGKKIYVWDSYGLEKYDLRGGSFSEDARGRWYFNVGVIHTPEIHTATNQLGIDLGLRSFAGFSNGEIVESKRFYRALEEKISSAQRANNLDRVRALHAKVKNRRKDFLHKLSTRLVNENGLIVVGNVNSKKLARTKMAKSVLDASWSMFRTMLVYKAVGRPCKVEIVNEAYTTQTCSNCGVIPTSSPKGASACGISEWTCEKCNSHHNRDVNAAKNILRIGIEKIKRETEEALQLAGSGTNLMMMESPGFSQG